MKKANIFIFFSLFAMMIYTAFSMQNRIIIPVRLTFDAPVSCFLPVLVLCCFIAGILFCAVFTFFYHTGDGNNKQNNQGHVAETEQKKKVFVYRSPNIPQEHAKQERNLNTEDIPEPGEPAEPAQLNFKVQSKMPINTGKICKENKTILSGFPGLSKLAGKSETAKNNLKSTEVKKTSQYAETIECIKCKQEISELVRMLSKS